MRSSTSWKRAATVRAALPLALALGALLGNAHAGPITPSYTVTDLGPGSPGGFSFSTAPNGQGIVIATDGHTAYPFQQVHDTVLDWDVVKTLPVDPYIPPTVPYDPTAPYSQIQGGIENANGIAAVTSRSSLNPLSQTVNVTAYYVVRNADGSWGEGGTMFSNAAWNQGAHLSVTAINDRNQVLGTMGPNVDQQGDPGDPVLYDINTKKLLDMTDYLKPPDANTVYGFARPLALDEQGRILLHVDVARYDDTGNPLPNLDSDDTLLLTPDGVSSAPIDLEAPEPSSLAVLALAMAALAHRRLRERRVR